MATNLRDFRSEWTPRIDELLDKQILVDCDQKSLAESMHYSVMAGGKRIRPLLTLATLKTIGISVDHDVLKMVCALELMHTYSLIHDDLPAMDNDDLRRGKATNHVKFGAGMATLAGDGLQALAFQWLVDNQLSVNVQSELTLNLAKAAGPTGMVSGQADDIEFEGTQLPLAKLQKLHAHKTGAILQYAINAGLIIGQVPIANRKFLANFGTHFGLAFQIYDDILDVIGDPKKIGKPVHQDKGKNTYPNLEGLAASRKLLQSTIAKAKVDLLTAENKLNVDTQLLAEFCNYLKIEDDR